MEAKVETTENYHRIPVSEGHGGHRIRTISISDEQGIRALYCGECREVITYLFDVDKWSMADAKRWVSEHKAVITEIGEQSYKVEVQDMDEIKQAGVSDRPWAQVDKSKLPASCFLIVGDPEHPTTWKLPYREGMGEINPETGRYRKAGPINKGAIRAILAVLAGARTGKPMPVPSEVREKVNRIAERLGIGEPAEKAVKAIEEGDDWIIEGLGAPYGGPFEGKDREGEFFDEQTDLGLDYYETRPAVFHHGLTEKEPEVIGREAGHEKRKDGTWVRIILDKTKELAKRAWELAQQGKLFFSSGAISHLVRKGEDGRILKWPIAEWSLTPNPANPYAVARATAKARFKAIGIEFDDGDPSDRGGEPLEGAERRDDVGGEAEQHKRGDKVSDEVKAAVEAALKEREEAEQRAKDEAELETFRKEVPELRKEIEELKAEKGRKPIFGEGDDTFEVKGSFWDQQEAADREMVYMMLHGAGRPISDELRRAVKGGLEEAVKGDPVWLRGDEDNPKALDMQIKAIALMDRTDTANWRPQNYEKRIWDRLRLENRAAAQFTNMDLPSDNYYLPTSTAGPTVYVVPEQTAGTPTLATGITTSQITDAKVTFATTKLGCAVWFSGELDEDAIVPQLPLVRDQMAKAVDEAVENGILNGDRTTGTSNISEATAATTSKNIVCDGLRHFGLVDATSFSRDCGALDMADVVAIRQLMAKYGIRPSDLVWFCDYNTIYKIIDFDEFITVDKYGPKAVVHAGEVGSLIGSPLIVSGEMNKYGTDGKYHATPTVGILIAAHKPSWIVGWRRRIKFGVNYYDHVDATRVTSLLRMDLQKFGSSLGHAGVGYNITL